MMNSLLIQGMYHTMAISYSPLPLTHREARLFIFLAILSVIMWTLVLISVVVRFSARTFYRAQANKPARPHRRKLA